MLSDYLKTFPQYVVPKQTLTTFAGLLANIKISAVKNHLIRRFIKKYGVDMTEARQENAEDYTCFNDFFIRQLKPECRPLANVDIISPVDGYVSEIGRIEAGKLIQAKKRDYSVQQLLACDLVLSKQFEQGVFATLYLSPKDYHRVHMPISGTPKEMIYIPGKLFSVQPTTARVIPRLFASNERLVVFFDTAIGLMAMVLVGATIVGGISTSWHGDVRRSRKSTNFIYTPEQNPEKWLLKGIEMGYFKLGSTVILLFAEGSNIQWEQHIKAGDKIQFGEPLGSIKK